MQTRCRLDRCLKSVALGIGCGLALLLSTPVLAAGGSENEFFGNCRFEGYAAVDPQRHEFRVEFDGTCTGLLDGIPILEAPVRISAEGTSTDVETVPVLAEGAGIAKLRPTTGRPTTIRFRLRRAGLVEHVTGECGGDAVVAVTPTAPPEDDRLAITGSMQTLSPLCG